MTTAIEAISTAVNNRADGVSVLDAITRAVEEHRGEVVVRDIRDDDTRPAGWWSSEDRQADSDMRGLTLAEARAEVLENLCDPDDPESVESVLSGTISILTGEE